MAQEKNMQESSKKRFFRNAKKSGQGPFQSRQLSKEWVLATGLYTKIVRMIRASMKGNNHAKS